MDHPVSARSSRGCGTGRLLTHLLHHFLFHFLRRGVQPCACPPSNVSLWAHYRPATIAPKHVQYLALGCCCETHSLGYHSVHVLHVEKYTSRRSANGLSAALTKRGIFWPQHQSRAAKCQLSVNRFAIGPFTMPRLVKPKAF